VHHTRRSLTIALAAAIIWAAVSAVAMTRPATPLQSKPAGGSTSEACTLLTKEDAAVALGEAVTGPKSSSGGRSMGGESPSSCEYAGSGLHKVNLNVMHFPPDTAAMYRALCAQKGKEGLSGLGDTACWYNDKHEELQVLKGTTFFSIELRRSGNPTEAIAGVAKKVFVRVK
jgi:hypothetical protein